ncbi:serine/threonine protein kinase [Lysobacter sp. CA199]|uniref:serine/threonine protein kinase n=1 Tax=Lysobacter sp. CA199 TaxID=3455608 RepID=UPI003F8D412D
MSAMTMELDDLKLAWQELDRKLERQYTMELLRFREERGQRMKSGLRPLAWGQALQMVFGVMCVILGTVFGLHHLGTAHLFAFGLIVSVYGIALIGCGAAMQALLADNDYNAPVVTIQKRLASLRKTYIRTGLAVGLVWWLLWMPFVSVLLMTLFGVDLYRNAPSVFVTGSVIGVIGLLASWGFYHWSRQPGRPRLAKLMNDSVTGVSLRRAQALLDEIKQFERE